VTDRSTSTKEDAPAKAVTTPSGTSPGNAVRAMWSATMRKTRAADQRKRDHHPVARPEKDPDDVGHDYADEADQPAHGGGGGDRRQRRGREQAHPGRADAERRGFGVAEGEHVESLAHRNTTIAAIVAYSRWATPHASR
jgi:hypothetical protein